MLVKLNWNFVGEALSIPAVHTDQVSSNSFKVFPLTLFYLHPSCTNVAIVLIICFKAPALSLGF